MENTETSCPTAESSEKKILITSLTAEQKLALGLEDNQVVVNGDLFDVQLNGPLFIESIIVPVDKAA